MINSRYSLVLSAGLLLLLACQIATPIGGPTPAVLETLEPTTPLETPTPELPTEPPTATPRPVLESPTPTPTEGPPTATFTPTPTPGPVEYVIQPNDTLLYIIQRPPFNYRDTSVITEILLLNPNIPSADRLPGPGSTILIPLPTPTPVPEGWELTQIAQPNLAQFEVLRDAEIVEYRVNEGETVLGIAQRNATTLAILATLNPGLGFFGCDFTNPSGGPDCNVSLQVGQIVNVPALTPTPTLSPTFSGNETPTPTPTYPPPSMVFPPQDASASARTFHLQWVSVGILQPQEYYVVQIEDLTAGVTHTDLTKNTSYELPESLIPTSGQPHQIRWRVSIGAPNEQGAYRIISGEGDWRSFWWQSR